MPTTYTHDLFGQKVYKRLPGNMRAMIREHGDLYRIGLHGPDILFYFMISKNPVSSFGVKMHKEKAREFFTVNAKRVRESGDEALTVYLLGFACHYLLDSAAHPYVNQMAGDGVISHTNVEKELDRTLMEDTGRDPYSYRPSDCVVPKYRYAKTIHKAIPQIRTTNIWISLKMMKFLTNLMIHNDGGRRRRVIHSLLHVGGKRFAGEMIEHFMQAHPVPGSEVPVERLKAIFQNTVDEAPGYLEELYDACRTEKELSGRWDRTYNG